MTIQQVNHSTINIINYIWFFQHVWKGIVEVFAETLEVQVNVFVVFSWKLIQQEMSLVWYNSFLMDPCCSLAMSECPSKGLEIIFLMIQSRSLLEIYVKLTRWAFEDFSSFVEKSIALFGLMVSFS